MKNKQNISFALVKIETDEFATFEENFLPEKEFSSKFEFGFHIDEKQHLIIWKFELKGYTEGKLFIKSKHSFIFQIAEESWDSLIEGSSLVLSKNLITHFAMLAMGIIRGILFEKVSKFNTSISSFILPLINVSDIITEDISVPLSI